MPKFAALLAALILSVSAPALAAEWHVADSTHFRVYSDDTAEHTTAYVAELERLNDALAIASGNQAKVEGATEESAKVTVFRFGETSDITGLLGPNSQAAGFFIPRAGGSVAFVPRKDDNQYERGARKTGLELGPRAILLHEYTHYFMFQHGAAAYPAWYTEGFAELFSTLQINPDSFVIGEPPSHRGYELAQFDIKLKSLLDPPKKMTAEDVYRTYAIGWLLTSDLTFNPARAGQLRKYLALYNTGIAPLEAAQQAFGDLNALDSELDKYRHSAARILKVPFAAGPAPQVRVRALTPDETARMDLMIHSKVGVTEEKAKKQVGAARSLVSQFPTSAPVLLAATEVEFDAGNLAESEALANRVLKADPASVDAAIYLAQIAMKRAKTDPSQYPVARRLFIAANKLDKEHPVPLAGYYLSYVFAGEEPPQAAIASLEGAFSHAPFDGYLRRAVAHMLLVQGDDEDALTVLGPLLNSAHGSQANKLRDLVTKFKAGERQPLIDKLAPKANDDEDKDDEDGGDDGDGKKKKKD